MGKVPITIDQFISRHAHQPRQLALSRKAGKCFVVESSKKDLHQQVFSILLIRYVLTDRGKDSQSKTFVECAITFIPSCFLAHSLHTRSSLIFYPLSNKSYQVAQWYKLLKRQATIHFSTFTKLGF